MVLLTLPNLLIFLCFALGMTVGWGCRVALVRYFFREKVFCFYPLVFSITLIFLLNLLQQKTIISSVFLATPQCLVYSIIWLLLFLSHKYRILFNWKHRAHTFLLSTLLLLFFLSLYGKLLHYLFQVPDLEWTSLETHCVNHENDRLKLFVLCSSWRRF